MAGSFGLRAVILIHRYLGIAIGLIVSLWCVSAFVMMYVQYPELTDAERVAGLEDLDLAGCCAGAGHASGSAVSSLLAEHGPIDGFRIEMLADRPVLRLMDGPRQAVLELATGESLDDLAPAEARRVSDAFAARMGIRGDVTARGLIERDQWTVYASYHPHRPLYQFEAADDAGTQWYVSGPSGEVVQITTARERFWNWLGSVTHWIYFTSLRQHTFAWAQTIIWLTIVATFLTVLGVYIGIKRVKRRRDGRLSPYRGIDLWHHYTGLVFGVLVLTWLVSGFFSMTPWGALEGRSFANEEQRLRGAALDGNDVTDVLAVIDDAPLPRGTVRLDSTVGGGSLALVAWDRGGERRLLDPATLATIERSDRFYESAAARMRPGVPVASSAWLESDDAYYFSHHEARPLPVYRIQYADGEGLYLDAVSGELVLAIDGERRWNRWLFEALHRGDFARIVRTRPIWDLFMLPLLLGVTVSALTGTWMGFRRLTR